MIDLEIVNIELLDSKSFDLRVRFDRNIDFEQIMSRKSKYLRNHDKFKNFFIKLE